MNIKTIAQVITGILFATNAFAQNTDSAVNYLNIPTPVLFNNVPYYLSWSSHPTSAYYKQEYIAKGDSLEHFKRMLTTDVLIGEIKIAGIVTTKLNELDKLKETNPVVNYQLFEKGDEKILDFLLSENTPDGNVSIIERNVYRYKQIVTKNGQKAILLFAVSDRAYKQEIDAFLIRLKGHKQDLVSAVAAFKLPEISFAK